MCLRWRIRIWVGGSRRWWVFSLDLCFSISFFGLSVFFPFSFPFIVSPVLSLSFFAFSRLPPFVPPAPWPYPILLPRVMIDRSIVTLFSVRSRKYFHFRCMWDLVNFDRFMILVPLAPTEMRMGGSGMESHGVCVGLWGWSLFWIMEAVDGPLICGVFKSFFFFNCLLFLIFIFIC